MAEDQTNTTLNDLISLMKEQTTKLDSIQKDIQTSKDEIKEYVNEKLGSFNETIEHLQQKIQNQDDTICTLQRKVLEQEIAEKKRNLILYNIVENEKSKEELVSSIIDLIGTKLNIDISKKDIDFLYRIGKKNNNKRPIVIGLTTLALKETILRNKNSLNEDNIRISEDFPETIREKRRELTPVVNSLYEKGFKVHMIRDQLIVNGEKWSLEKAIETVNGLSNKRSSSDLSPPETQPTNHKKEKLTKLKLPTPSHSTVQHFPNSRSPRTPSIKNYMFTNGKVLTPNKNIQITEVVSLK